MADYETLRWAVAHDPCRSDYRSPLGAVTVGSTVDVLLWVNPELRHHIEAATLLVGSARYGRESLSWRTVPLTSCTRGLSGSIAPPSGIGVQFYLFSLKLSDGSSAIYAPRADGKTTAGRLVVPGLDGSVSDHGWVPTTRSAPGGNESANPLAAPAPGFQISYYSPDFETPEWLSGPVMYQIFPDRFARAEKGINAQGLAYHRAMERAVILHENWNEQMMWKDGPGYDPVDFFGGSLEGIREKLGYLASLGVEVLYLNPIFEARSNHRYDTASYEQVDPLLGTNEDFARLAQEAEELGIRIILDAVLSHTGADSVYFNARETYPSAGASQSTLSPYRSWYDFDHPNGAAAPYRCWWGDPSLPEVNEHNVSWQHYVIGDLSSREDNDVAILPRWIGNGAAGYRLDVADEIPDEVLSLVRASVKDENPNAAIIGEVWEDATNKISYGSWRNYALGPSLDSVMNYPLRNALLSFALNSADAYQVATFLKTQQSNYPAPLYRSLMNLMSTHDVERQRTILAFGGPIKHLPRAHQAVLVQEIKPAQDARAARLQRIIAGILYALPGMPCLYYGDECGLHGGGDPFCRASFPWRDATHASGVAGARLSPSASRDAAQDPGFRGDQGEDLTAFYQKLGQLRRDSALLRQGDTFFCAPQENVLCVARTLENASKALIAIANRSNREKTVSFDAADLVGQGAFHWTLTPLWSSDPERAIVWASDGLVRAQIPPLTTVYFATVE